MGKISVSCPNCQAKYRVTVQGEVTDKISFTCKKCQQLIEIHPDQLGKDQEPTTELIKTVCEKCGNEFVKNIEDTSNLCYQCRIDRIVQKKKQAKPKEEKEKSASRYTFRNPDGLVLGPIKLRTVAVLIREKRIRGDEEVSKDGSEYRPISDYPELVELFPELDLSIKKEEQKEAGEEAEFYFRLRDGREFGPVRKSTISDLISCGFLSEKELISKDCQIWTHLGETEEFKDSFAKKDTEIIDLTETVEE